MAFIVSGLQQYNSGGALSTGAGSVKKMWHYVTNDLDTVVETDGYFDSTAMNIGDLLFASIDVDGTPEVKAYIVSIGTGDPSLNDVTVAPMIIV